ncbi:UNVERIFIED_CONTAM: hypothetical protein GTU68_054191 [Idotea baltica]|nr:hypothetical protein [Idotea baltica]
MRTPGMDNVLAAGFLFTEGIIQSNEDILSIESYKDCSIEIKKTERNFYTTSSCGVCGKASIEAIQTKSQYPIQKYKGKFASSLLVQIQELIAQSQEIFNLTGGIHAAAIFNNSGKIEYLAEDVGRHNAVDKIIGQALLENNVPLNEKLLFLSGRASFELIQKASMAAIPIIVAVGAPSSLAYELALANEQTLIGFLKKESFNIYTHEERIR